MPLFPFLKRFRRLGSASGEGSVFTKISKADDKLSEAKGRILAVDAANAAKRKQAADLESEAARVHGESDAVITRFDTVLSAL